MKSTVKNSKGVTLIALVTTIIVLLILASVATYSGIEIVNSSKLTTFTTEMKIMQTQVNGLYDQWKKDEINKDAIGKDLKYNTEVEEQANQVLVEELGIENSVDDIEGYRYYDQETIQELGIEGIEQEFFINIEKREVVSYKGLKYEGDMYYTLNQLPQGLYNVDYDPQQVEAPTFDVSYEKIGDSKYRITISNIQYEGYIEKWYVRYQEDQDDSEANWNTTEDMSFVVDKSWIYNIQIYNGEVKSEIKSIFVNDVNEPELSEGMIPIKWDDSKGKWVICSENDPEWYNYVDQLSGVDQTSKWANVMLSDGKYYAQNSSNVDKTNKEAGKVGQVVEEADLGSMFVWIPRYAYSIESGYHTNTAGKINISFLKGTEGYGEGEDTCYTSQGEIGRVEIVNESGEGNWNEHPAFNYGGTIIPGIWVAKFEASSTTSTPDEDRGGGDVTNLNIKVLPGKQSWRRITVGNAYTNCVNMNNTSNANYYGLSTDDNEIDPHLLKNSEWGAVAYLTQSSYGRNENEVTPNVNGYSNVIYIYTGYAGEGTSDGNSIDSTIAPTNVHYYDTDEGVLASTTGNETGIYDMSGGSWDKVAAYVDNGNVNLGIDTVLFNAPEKHKDVYEAITSDGNKATNENDDPAKNYEKMETIFGDAVWETSNGYIESNSWNGDNSYSPRTTSPIFHRGGNYSYYGSSGIFSFIYDTYLGDGYDSFCPSIVVY